MPVRKTMFTQPFREKSQIIITSPNMTDNLSSNTNGKNKAEINDNSEIFYVVSRKIIVKFTNEKNYQQFVDQVIKIGVYTITSAPFSEQDFSLQYQAGLSKAVKEAKNKAKEMATPIGESNVILHSLKETSNVRCEYEDYLHRIRNDVSTAIIENKT